MKMGQKYSWENVLLTDSGFFFDNELDKPLIPLIYRFKEMLNKPFDEVKILFIPTAAMQDKAKAAEITDRLLSELIKIGVQKQNITIYNIDGLLTDEEAMEFDVIYFTGGNTLYLAKCVREKGFDKIIKKMVYANKVYVGMSAGSMLAMENFNVDGLYEKTPLDFIGLGLIKAYFTVHCKPGTPNRTDLPLPHIALQCNQALEVNSNGYKLIENPYSNKLIKY